VVGYFLDVSNSEVGDMDIETPLPRPKVGKRTLT